MTYAWVRAAPVGERVRAESVQVAAQPLDLGATYTVSANSFLAEGGDTFTVFREGTNRVVGPVDLDALIAYIEGSPQPVAARLEQRIAVR